MDFDTLPDGYLTAGRDYLKALLSLGLNPQGLLWAFDRSINQFALVLITQHLDISGPREIYRLLNKAYLQARTPQSIDPFIVRLHSLNQLTAVHIGEYARIWGKETDPPMDFAEAADLVYKPAWVLHLRPATDSESKLKREWQHFRKSVDKQAA